MATQDVGSSSAGTVDFQQIFAEELRHVARRRAGSPLPNGVDDQLTPERAFDLGLTGLALSGGGIRSAAFNLGLLQALVNQDVVGKIDYLSTVSGGGYIGASLTSLGADTAGAFRTGEGGVEPPEVGHIRQHGSYLAPRPGLLRIDTWRMISTYVTGLVLVLLTIGGMLALLAFLAFHFVAGGGREDLDRMDRPALWMALVQKRVADFDIDRIPDDRLRPAFIDWAEDFRQIAVDEDLRTKLTGWIAEARALTRNTLRERIDVWLYECRAYADNRDRLWDALFRAITPAQIFQNPSFSPTQAKITAGQRASGTLRTWWIDGFADQQKAAGVPASDRESIAAHFFTLFKIDPVPAAVNDQSARDELFRNRWRHPAPLLEPSRKIVLAPVVLWGVLGALFLVASILRGRRWEPAIRRGLARSMGYALVTTAVLTAVAAMPFLHAAVASFPFGEILGVSTLVSVISVVASLRAAEGKGETGQTLKRLAFHLGAWTLVVSFCLVVVYVAVSSFLVSETGGTSFVDRVTIAMIVLILVTDINRVSLLYFYRDRIADAFIIRRSPQTGGERRNSPADAPSGPDGVVRRIRHATIRGLYSLGAWVPAALMIAPLVLFSIRWSERGVMISVGLALLIVGTGAFAALVDRYKDLMWRSDALAHVRTRGSEKPIGANDELRLSDLAERTSDGPYPLINTAVNLAGSADLRLRGRKADFFLLSPLYCGSKVTGYVATDRFERSLDNLATAVAVSGAATNPLLGRASRPAFAFLMTLCNLRLGMWVQNPRYARRRDGLRKWAMEAVLHVRRWWPYYIVKELLGKSDERGRHINLSDGGHIENLGVFELLRRRCRVIIASDAGADPECTFGDLGDLLRMARIDLGVDLRDLETSKLRPKRSSHLSESHTVTAEIIYEGEKEPGTLIYVKAALTEADPVDLHAYRVRQPRFPHETTIDQSFDEGQFEAYRVLGYESGIDAAALFNHHRSVPAVWASRSTANDMAAPV